ncbi:hypothetical protein [Phenylobacterium soli]|uniref:Uncharacterized protein n=1 Tax=Phenylobacterium soli TaxID=2170551 RepID=A0A328AF12_9CAUL|nr:hypothetical protein [Phenylobacterium soli]RAK53125.1 hypothetical protein DJ017_00550 [Phenylobacterium soli]
MPDDPQVRAWFAPKQYGYGATPSSWEGWAVTLGFVLIVTLTAAFIAPADNDLPHRLGLYRLALVQRLHPSTAEVLALVAVESVAFIALTRWKSSGPWLWRWGSGR